MPKPSSPRRGDPLSGRYQRTITYGKQQIAVADDVYMTGKMIKELNAMPEFEGAIGDVEDLPQGVVI